MSSSNEVVAYCIHCGATGPWEGYISALDREKGSGTIVPTKVRELDRQFGEYEGHYNHTHFFKLPFPYNKIPLSLYEGSDIMATRGKETLLDGTYYNGDEDRFEVEIPEGGVVIEGRWII
jgi:hypothetical protein